MAKKTEGSTRPRPQAPAKGALPKGRSIGHTLIWIVLLLVFVGLGGYGTVQFSGTVRSLGTVGESEIPITRYRSEVEQQIRLISQQTGLPLTFAQAQAFGLDRAALAQVINEIALENEARRMGLSVGDDAVNRQLVSIQAFQDLNGRFSPELYRDALRRAGIPVTEFEAGLRAESARALMVHAIEQGAEMPPELAAVIFRWAGERRSFDWAELAQGDLTAPLPAPSDDDLRAYHDEHADSYKLPEIRKITYVWITPEMLARKIEVDDDDLHKLYDSRLSQYVKPERRLVERLVFGSDEEAQAAHDRLTAGETDFEALVAERGLTLDDVNLDEVTRDDLGPAADAVFALTEPGVTGPVETSLGPALFRVNAILEAETTPFEAVRDELKAEFTLDRARRMIQDLSEELDDLLAGGATLEEVAEETDLELGHVDWSDEVSEGIAGYAAFRKAAAAAAPDDFSEAVGLDDGGLFALRLDEVVPPAVQPFETVERQVREDWNREALRKALEALADEIVPRIEAGEDPASFGLSVNHVAGVTRDEVLADTPPGLVDKAFELASGKAARLPGIEGTDTVAIVATTDIIAADPDDPQLVAGRAQFTTQATAALKSDLIDAFVRAVSEDAKVRIDQNVLDQVNAQIN